MIKTVYVFFEEASIRLFFMKYLANGFSHCFTYEHQLLDKYDVFVKIESLFYCFDTDIFFGSVDELLLDLPKKRIKITLNVDPEKRTLDFMPTTCVSVVKKQLGINKPFIITPKQLYSHLIKIGGKEI